MFARKYRNAIVLEACARLTRINVGGNEFWVRNEDLNPMSRSLRTGRLDRREACRCGAKEMGKAKEDERVFAQEF